MRISVILFPYYINRSNESKWMIIMGTKRKKRTRCRRRRRRRRKKSIFFLVMIVQEIADGFLFLFIVIL